ncbi:MAG TPA: glycoside hydrolase family 30 beta sandwich domain-containing protein [Gemmatimonadaceae bacterium]
MIRLPNAGRIAAGVLLTAACAGSKAATEPTPVIPPPPGHAVEVWMTTADGVKQLSHERDATLGAGTQPAGTAITVDPTQQYQEIVGFGAAITDASAWLIQNRMSASQRDALMQELFGRNPGIGLSFTRLTIGASDFSMHDYSLDDMPAGQSDPTLAHFSIDSNRPYLLPTVKQAYAINPALAIMASPWSSPGWMKTTGSLIKGTLTDSGYPALAEYLRRYVKAYEAEGLPIFALTVQNEPHFEPENYPGMSLPPASRARLFRDHLGPLFAREGIRTKLLDWDHNWDQPESPLAVLADTAARKYVGGVAWHCYNGDVSAQGQVHDAYPDKETYFTECSGGEWSPAYADNLRFFVGTLVIDATRNWAKGVLLWNLALDENHGPHLGGCADCRGVVTIDSRSGAVTRNVEYYALGHASRFVRPRAHRIASSSGVEGVKTVAFLNADDGSKVLVVMNTAPLERTIVVHVGTEAFNYVVPAGAAVTFHWG